MNLFFLWVFRYDENLSRYESKNSMISLKRQFIHQWNSQHLKLTWILFKFYRFFYEDFKIYTIWILLFLVNEFRLLEVNMKSLPICIYEIYFILFFYALDWNIIGFNHSISGNSIYRLNHHLKKDLIAILLFQCLIFCSFKRFRKIIISS